MPVYMYQCDNCGVRFERRQSFNEPALTKCPECSKKTLRKIFTPVGIVFKGSGFYATDHRSPSGQGRSTKSAENEKKAETSESKPDSSSSTTSEKKPAPAT